jgi:ABC-2 type transport system permease protein
MKAIFTKEISQFFSNLTGYLAMGVFLLLMGLFLFIFPDTSLLDYGYATLDKFFELAPWVLLLLVPAVGMRSFADEFKTGTWELLRTKPLTNGQIIGGKFLAAWVLCCLALLPGLLYVFTIKMLSITGSIDSGGIIGSFAGLILLTGLFSAVGICASAATSNAVVAFLLSAFGCFFMFQGFDAISGIPAFEGGADFWLEKLGANVHYRNMSRGVIETGDVFYFMVVGLLFLLSTKRFLMKRAG